MKRQDTETETVDFTTRVVLAMQSDVTKLLETAERVRIQFCALAREHGVAAPAVASPSD